MADLKAAIFGAVSPVVAGLLVLGFAGVGFGECTDDFRPYLALVFILAPAAALLSCSRPFRELSPLRPLASFVLSGYIAAPLVLGCLAPVSLAQKYFESRALNQARTAALGVPQTDSVMDDLLAQDKADNPTKGSRNVR